MTRVRPKAVEIANPPVLERDGEVAAVRQALVEAVARVCPGWLADRRDDIVQDAVLRVMRRRAPDASGAPPPASYLWKTAYCATIDEIRRTRAAREVPLDDDLGDPVAALRRSGDPDRAAEGSQIGAAIADCLGKLSDNRRAAVTLRLQEHLVGEIAQLLGWDAKRAENYVYRGLAELRACLEGKGVTP